MNRLVTVIGASGVGKTALVDVLARTGKFITAYEQHVERPFQALFKQDSRHALANQVDYFLFRAHQERELRGASPARLGLMDGGLDLDFNGFTRLFHARGLLTTPEYDLCGRLYAWIRSTLPLPELIVHMCADEATVARRLSRRERINIAEAQDTALFHSYLDEWLAGLPPAKVLQLDVSQETLEYRQSTEAILARLSL